MQQPAPDDSQGRAGHRSQPAERAQPSPAAFTQRRPHLEAGDGEQRGAALPGAVQQRRVARAARQARHVCGAHALVAAGGVAAGGERCATWVGRHQKPVMPHAEPGGRQDEQAACNGRGGRAIKASRPSQRKCIGTLALHLGPLPSQVRQPDDRVRGVGAAGGAAWSAVYLQLRPGACMRASAAHPAHLVVGCQRGHGRQED